MSMFPLRYQFRFATSSIAHALLLLLIASFATVLFAQEDPFRTNIRPTPWLTPQQEQASFTLPPGFEIQLFAAEPQIQKPMNMAFDARGRLWLTDTREYPIPVPEGQAGRDTIKILEDTNGDGRADKITTFAEGLNIPIGLVPYGEGAIVWSIPNIWYLRDTDGDGQADRREKLYGPMGWQRDTHGMNNGFTRGYDGWIYACHGFNNQTTVAGADGHEINMQSGNTYRFRPDGSRIEHYTHGQVNPFGMTITPQGDLITADCHSKPLYLLLPGGYYPSFGRPHDGLGFVPPIMTHSHGSTALSGPCYYAADNFPAEFRGNVFVGNVMTGRVNRNQLQWHGSTPQAIELPDLVASSDPWFRPVDIQQGPDGAVYVADFYNRIIGHYEVPLDHEGRDRTSGRIWRVVYTGDDTATSSSKRPVDLKQASTDEIVAALDSKNFTQQLAALNYLVDQRTPEFVTELAERSDVNQVMLVSALERTGQLTAARFDAALQANLDNKLVGRLGQILGEHDELDSDMHEWLLDLLADDHYRGVVHRQVAAALARHTNAANTRPLLAAMKQCPADDTLLNHQLQITLRNHLRLAGVLEQLELAELDPNLAALTAEAALGTDTAAAGNFLVAYLVEHEIADAEQAARYGQHAARFAGDVNFDALAAALPIKLKDQPLRQLAILQGIGDGLQQCGCQPSPALTAWCKQLVGDIFQSERATISWSVEALPGKPHRADMFVVGQRKSSDGDTQSAFFDSLPLGETLCGVYRSGPFNLPAELSFYLAGHNGFPDAQQRTGNMVRLVDATTGQVIRQTPPPRNDVAQRVAWKLRGEQGQQARIEILDADDHKAYAWLAVGRFSVEGLNPSNHDLQLREASELIVDWGLSGFDRVLEKQLRMEGLEPNTVAALATALLASHADDVRLTALASLLEQPVSPLLRGEIVKAVIAREARVTREALAAAMKQSPAAAQQKLAEQLAASPWGATALVELISQGNASPRLLAQPKVKEKLSVIEDVELHQTIAALTRSLPPANEAIGQRIAETRRRYTSAEVLPQRGHLVFKKNCAACHKIGEQGEMIAPQLDGIGNRGLDRLLEDLLDPHRNVDIQFRTTTLVLTDGKILSGLLREAEGEPLELIDSQGKKLTLAAAQVEQRKASPLSLMPDNMVDKLSPQELNDLLAFLLEQTGQPTTSPEN